jgi:hypothetical protein
LFKLHNITQYLVRGGRSQGDGFAGGIMVFNNVYIIFKSLWIQSITYCFYWYARQDSNPAWKTAGFRCAQPAAYGFEVQESENSKTF